MAVAEVVPLQLSSQDIQTKLAAFVSQGRILIRPIELIAYASDASFYRLIPKAVVQAQGLEEIRALFAFSRQHRIPMTFRAAGTSLSGQAVSDGLLVDIARNWRTVNVEDGGKEIRLQPGVIGARANAALAPYKANIGPDPASIATCTIGGILSNNSSGMCCGVEQNAYHTLKSMKFMLPSGTVIDTSQPDADAEFHAHEPELARGILELKQRLERSADLRDRVRNKYKRKNTTGYSLNAFLDFDTAVDIFQHLLIGSEGTLAFIAEAVMHTVPDLPVKYTGLLLYSDLYAAADSIVPLRTAGAKALEIMDRASLRSVENQAGIPASIKTLPEGAAGLLVEFQSAEESSRTELEALAKDAVGGLKLFEPARFTHAAAEQALLWKIRAGIFPSVGSVRQSGTTVIIEDVAFPVEVLADATYDLNRLFVKHQYSNAIVFGHAKDGNLHFVITQSFNDQAAIDQYSRFIDDLVELVVRRYDGALKAEHGTGRNMAPFVETEWGGEAYQIMRQLKRLADPDNLLNPGVIINSDPRAHLADLKRIPSVEAEIDKCIECGYCEPKCPSRELTLTPRQRIVVRREMARQQIADNGSELWNALDREFPYMALDTCATDGLCATACPVNIDTGQLVKRLRNVRASLAEQRWAERIVNHFGATESGLRWALRLGHAAEKVIGVGGLRSLTGWLKRFGGANLSEWMSDTPFAAAGVPRTRKENARAVYFPACISRIMGRLPGEPRDKSLIEITVELAQRAGVPVYIPSDVAGTCCGMPFSSKGFTRAHTIAVNRAVERFWRWSDEGKLSVVIDTSPCAYSLKTARAYLSPENQNRFDLLIFLDAIEFVHDELLPRLTIQAKADSVALHPVCSVTKMGITAKLEGIAKACSDQVLIPESAGCCAFAGDRGFLVPELTQSATKREAAEVQSQQPDSCYSSSRTCEIGMSRATGRIYRSYMYLLERAT
ncbi:MAG: FAD-binding and (Fe-S)-binding domain-containing protein, partial [Candidatus Sulfotelmatobacter sp.]